MVNTISTMSTKVLGRVMIMTFFTYVSWPSHVPAVAVIRGRRVLFIFNRFKGYPDGIFSPDKKKGTK